MKYNTTNIATKITILNTIPTTILISMDATAIDAILAKVSGHRFILIPPFVTTL